MKGLGFQGSYNSYNGQVGKTSISSATRCPSAKRKHPAIAIMAALSVYNDNGGR